MAATASIALADGRITFAPVDAAGINPKFVTLLSGVLPRTVVDDAIREVWLFEQILLELD